MLTVPRNWAKIHGGEIARQLLAQIDDHQLRIEFARHILQASFPLLDARLLRRNHRLTRIRALANMRWRFGDGAYAYFPDPDDLALKTCLNRLTALPIWTVIVPSSFEFVFRAALEAASSRWKPSLFTLDGYVDWRTMWAGVDLGTSHERVNQFLIRRFHRSLVRRDDLSSLRIDRAERFRKRKLFDQSVPTNRSRSSRATRRPS
jgi:hypothetical protein